MLTLLWQFADSDDIFSIAQCWRKDRFRWMDVLCVLWRIKWMQRWTVMTVLFSLNQSSAEIRVLCTRPGLAGRKVRARNCILYRCRIRGRKVQSPLSLTGWGQMYCTLTFTATNSLVFVVARDAMEGWCLHIGFHPPPLQCPMNIFSVTFKEYMSNIRVWMSFLSSSSSSLLLHAAAADDDDDDILLGCYRQSVAETISVSASLPLAHRTTFEVHVGIMHEVDRHVK